MTHDRPTNRDLAALTGPELEGAPPAQAYRIGVECGHLLALLEALNRRLDAHLLRLGIPQAQLDAAADGTEPCPITTTEN